MKVDEVHLWNGRIAAGEECFSELYGRLSQDEIEKANGLHFDKDRRSYIVCRGLLRFILAAYLELEPTEIQFQYGSQGKPFLPNQAMHFSVGHSADRVLYAFSRTCDVGIDLEHVRELRDADMLAQRFFAPSECGELRDTSPAARTRAFLCCWTRKEAYIKATGQGLSLPLDSFHVPTTPEPAEKLKIMIWPGAHLWNWSLRHLDPAPGYVGALAVSLPSFRLVERTFETAEGCVGKLRIPLRGNSSS
jgi:4'-phosphopantetheinyl transferase